ncbi:hypothetical protein ACFU44_03980 [Nocardia rhizosphaerihabitans]|uniref:hypothetical protein n=1 Tax=Nocardia rhizosphaerihabitans TaxID=1691570 RepID=UPI003672DB4F
MQTRGGHTRTVLRYHDGRPITSRRIDHLFHRLRTHLPWAHTLGNSPHWIRHTTLTHIERLHGLAIARAFAGHDDSRGNTTPTTLLYVRADLLEVVTALATLTGQQHPLTTRSARLSPPTPQQT